MPWVAMVCSDMSEANLDKKLGASSLHIRKDKSIETIEAAKKVLGSLNLNFCFVHENLQPLCAFILTTELRHEKKNGKHFPIQQHPKSVFGDHKVISFYISYSLSQSPKW